MSPIDKIIEEINSKQLWQEEMTFARNEYLKVAGSIDTNIYFVKSGSLRLFVIDEFEEHTIRFGYENNLIGALDSFITENPSDIYIQALKKTEVKIIDKPSFKSLISNSAEIQKYWNEILEGLVFQQLERERDILTSSPMERYKRVLKRSPHLFQIVPNKYIASYLRMTPETLSRLKKY